MQGKGRFVFLGVSSFQGRKDTSKTFFNLSVLQGAETFQIMLDEGQQHIFKDSTLYDELEIDYNVTARYDKYKNAPVLNMRINSVIFADTGEIPDLAPELPKDLPTDSKPENEKKLKAV